MINLHLGDSLEIAKTLETGSVQTIVTSPPYWGLRDYGVAGQLGLERTPEEYVCHLVELFRELRRVLRDDGTLWLNLGDSFAGSNKGMGKEKAYGGAKQLTNVGSVGVPVQDWGTLGLKPKDLVGIPWRVAFALQADGWYLRSDIIWHKPNPMPESVTDRPTKAHEYIFLLSKSSKYYYDADAVRERATSDFGKGKTDAVQKYSHMKRNIAHSGWLGGDGETRNKRSVWTVTTKPFKGAHFATFPKDLIAPCILAGAPVGGVVLDPFTGSGTTGLVSVELGRSFVGMELNPEYHAMATARIATAQAPLPYAVTVS
jgi:DNA modification methylase